LGKKEKCRHQASGIGLRASGDFVRRPGIDAEATRAGDHMMVIARFALVQ